MVPMQKHELRTGTTTATLRSAWLLFSAHKKARVVASPTVVEVSAERVYHTRDLAKRCLTTSSQLSSKKDILEIF